MRTPIQKFLAVSALVALSACDTVQGARLFTPESTEFDGAWIGRMSIGIHLAECRLQRGGLRVRIDGGRMEGQARFSTTEGEFSGVVDENGEVRYATLRGTYAKDDVEFIGTFTETNASGTWSSKVCHGEWELRKAR